MVDVGFSLARRSVFSDRAVVIASRDEDLLAGLRALEGGGSAPNVLCGTTVIGGTAFLFGGQGAQRVGMGLELYEAFAVFRDAFDEVCGSLDGLLGRSLREVVFGIERASDVDAAVMAELLDDTAFAQPGLFALEVALFRLVESWGVRPDFLFGHSIGEVTAAHVAGVFSLTDACALVAARGRLMGDLPGAGAMVAVGASERDVLESLEGLEDRVAVAGVNGPTSVVISGDEGAVLGLADLWRGREVRVQRLRVSDGFHSPRMDGVLPEFGKVLASLSFSPPSIPIVSNVTGEQASADDLCSSAYWVRHVREPVRFMDGVRWCWGEGARNFLELGPGGVLSALGQECVESWEGAGNGAGAEPHDAGNDSANGMASAFVPGLRADRGELEALVGAIGELWVRGMSVDWEEFLRRAGGARVELPSYAFQRERYWLGSGTNAGDVSAAGLTSAEHPLLGAAIGFANGDGWLFTGRLSLDSHPWLADHAVMGTVLLPGTAFVEMALHVEAWLGARWCGSWCCRFRWH